MVIIIKAFGVVERSSGTVQVENLEWQWSQTGEGIVEIYARLIVSCVGNVGTATMSRVA